MFQFHQEQISLTPVICNKVKHQGENIRSLCLNPDCKMNSAVCSSCLNSDHQNCRIYVKDLQEIQIKLMELQAL